MVDVDVVVEVVVVVWPQSGSLPLSYPQLVNVQSPSAVPQKVGKVQTQLLGVVVVVLVEDVELVGVGVQRHVVVVELVDVVELVVVVEQVELTSPHFLSVLFQIYLHLPIQGAPEEMGRVVVVKDVDVVPASGSSHNHLPDLSR